MRDIRGLSGNFQNNTFSLL